MLKSRKIIEAKCTVNLNYLAHPHFIVHFNKYQGFLLGVYCSFETVSKVKDAQWDKWGCIETS